MLGGVEYEGETLNVQWQGFSWVVVVGLRLELVLWGAVVYER